MTDDHDNVIRFPHCARRVDDLDAEPAKLEGLLGTTRMRYYKRGGSALLIERTTQRLQ